MSDSYSLLCYTRVPTSREEANNEDIAFSMHLALLFVPVIRWLVGLPVWQQLAALF